MREPSLTFEGALRILGQHEHKTIERIDKLLGGVLLGSGAVAGAIALGATPLAPLAAFGAMWGWIEQKGLAVDLLKSAVDAVSARMSGLRGYERRELIAAAHSTIVVASVFEALREETGDEFYRNLKITDATKAAVMKRVQSDLWAGRPGRPYGVEIPAPSASCGFEENVEGVTVWQVDCLAELLSFLSGLTPAESARINRTAVLTRAIERYKSRYLELAAKVPEFAIWAQLGEHAATRTAVRANHEETMDRIAGLREMNADVLAALGANRNALNRIQALLSLPPGSAGLDEADPPAQQGQARGLPGLCQAVSWANAGILGRRIIPVDPERHPSDLTIPQVREIYVNPRYRAAESPIEGISRVQPELDAKSYRPADDQWWDSLPSRADFDVMLSAHVTSPDATRLPLLLLGHPGAGKSLLTKVFAARLPDSEYTVVRVPLRRVSADARIHHQIEEALEIGTDQRIEWSDLAEQSAAAGTVRVVLLDGLDELLQASEHDRSSYLEDVVEFQERELQQRRPVVVIVTSRTVVADRVRIPGGTTIVKLDPFSHADIADWLWRWNQVNADAIAAGAMGELTWGAVRRQPELVAQPLLLLMLALYAADPELPPLDEEMATAELYRQLLDGFARREAGKDLGLGHDPSHGQLEQLTRDHLDRLAIAALGMFNRGRQDVGEEEIGKDLEALEPRLMERSRPTEAGQRIISAFFFVHAPEALATAGQRGGAAQPRRAYEFLHATFGEYLVARRVMDELVDVTVRAFSGWRGPAVPDDDLLFALLSLQALAVRASVLDFAREIYAGLGATLQSEVRETLETLFSTYRNRHGSDRYAAYRPAPPDQVSGLAYYSANLVALRVQLQQDGTAVPLADLLRRTDGALKEWRGTPRLWRTALDNDSLRAMLTSLDLVGNPSSALTRASMPEGLSNHYGDILLARLEGNQDMERRLRYGIAILDDFSYYFPGQQWADSTASHLIAAISDVRHYPGTVGPPPGTADEDIRRIARLIFIFLRVSPRGRPGYREALELLFALPRVFEIDELALAAAAVGQPQFRDEVPQLQDFGLYGKYSEIVNRSDQVPLGEWSQAATWANPAADVVYAVTDVLRDLRQVGLTDEE